MDTLPVMADPAVRSAGGHMPLRAMICEDEGLVVVQLRHALASAGYTVVGEAMDGETAIRMALDLSPDFILMDITLCGMNGIEATRRILQKRSIPVIILTAHDDDDTIRQAIDAGACGY